jgi:hypothetical protein
MGPDNLEKVLERMAVTDKSTLVYEKAPEGKIRVTSSAWADERVILKGQVLEARNVDGRLHVARKERHHDDWDRRSSRMSPTGGAIRVTHHAHAWPLENPRRYS